MFSRASSSAAAILCVAVLLPSSGAAQTTTTAHSAGTMSAAAEARETTTTAQPSDEISTDSVDFDLITSLVIRFTNEQREKEGLEPVQPDAPLREVATSHSRDMAQRGYFSHTSERDDAPDIPFGERVSLEKLGYRRTGENIALQPIVESREIETLTSSSGETTQTVTLHFASYEELARKTVQGWMNSPGHRKNILTPEFNAIGIGIATGEREGTPYTYITQNFGQKPAPDGS
jgi:uncharacterized protein YkwD